MLIKPLEPHIGSIDGDRYIGKANYLVNFADWLTPWQFEIYKGTITDIATVPRCLRWMYDRASLGILAPYVHDFLCTCRGKFINTFGVEVEISWFDTQLFFLVAMRLDGIPPRRAFLAFLAVVFGNKPRW